MFDSLVSAASMFLGDPMPNAQKEGYVGAPLSDVTGSPARRNAVIVEMVPSPESGHPDKRVSIECKDEAMMPYLQQEAQRILGKC